MVYWVEYGILGSRRVAKGQENDSMVLGVFFVYHASEICLGSLIDIWRNYSERDNVPHVKQG